MVLHLSRRGKIRPAINLKNIIEAHKTHGLSHHPIYKVWTSMKYRCDNPKCPGYEHWGGRGIRYTAEWNNFETFFVDVVNGYNKDLQLDRIDNDGNYEPKNVRWATREQQVGNQRRCRRIEYDGAIMILADWAKVLEVNDSVLSNYIKKYSFEKAYYRYSNRTKKYRL